MSSSQFDPGNVTTPNFIFIGNNVGAKLRLFNRQKRDWVEKFTHRED
jgi:hypothetical protein